MTARVIRGSALFCLASLAALAQTQFTGSPAEQAIVTQLRGLRSVPDSQRGAVTTRLALEIRQLPKTSNKLRLAEGLANLSTEGDFGHATLQEVATTLAAALTEQPVPDENGSPAAPYMTLAQLVRYEGVAITFDSGAYGAAMDRLAAEDKQRASADFTLRDLKGREWKLSDLRGQVVLVNFWATWCPPCRKEIPDLIALSAQFSDQGLVILGISDESADKVAPFVQQYRVPYPVLLDPGRQVNGLFSVEGIPKSFVYNREGKLAATAIDMRTRQQFQAMLAKAGL